MHPEKPVINLDELELETDAVGNFVQRYAGISHRIGARKLGYNLTVVPPGKTACPFHNHRVQEEMFFILEGTGCLRFGGREYPLRALDVIAAPAGGRELAHQILNTGESDLKYLALSTMEDSEICEYPDSDKIGVYCGETGKRDLRKIFRAGQDVDYYDGEIS